MRNFIHKNLKDEYFQCIDRDGSGEIDLKEFFTFFQMKDTAFARRAFSVMDEDG